MRLCDKIRGLSKKLHINEWELASDFADTCSACISEAEAISQFDNDFVGRFTLKIEYNEANELIFKSLKGCAYMTDFCLHLVNDYAYSLIHDLWEASNGSHSVWKDYGNYTVSAEVERDYLHINVMYNNGEASKVLSDKTYVTYYQGKSIASGLLETSQKLRRQ